MHEKKGDSPMSKQRILVVGSGGREHAMVWSLGRSPQVDEVFVAPGNAGTAQLATNVPVAADDLPGLLALAREKGVSLTLVGPEAPLAAGVVDLFQAHGLAVFGPGRDAAQLESSKAFAKAFMHRHGIPTAAATVFTAYPAARRYLESLSPAAGVVVKASGLAAGKGVIMCDNPADAEAALHEIMVEKAFGPAGEQVLIEDRLSGPEVSLLAFSDGRTVAPMLPARDHKRAYDYDAGPNTGGMGAFAPPPELTGPAGEAFVADIVRTVLQPVVDGMAAEGTPYVGVLYAGLMLTSRGPKVLEFNCRFGDPETQVILPMLETDLLDVAWACVQGRLHEVAVRTRPGACATVVMAAPGYPGVYPKGAPIHGVDAANALRDVIVFHAGTAVQDGRLVTAGGRVLAVSALGADLPSALERAYAGVGHIHFEGAHFRRDIGRNA